MCNASTFDRRIDALALARDCALLGARARTIHLLTGLADRELKQYSHLIQPAQGRAPDTRDWYHTATLHERIESSILMANFQYLRGLGFGAAQSLVESYRFYRSCLGGRCRISFDRAFDLAAHTAGMWLAHCPSFQVLPCPACRAQGLQTLGAVPAGSRCPFCKLAASAQPRPRARRRRGVR
ncbi:FlhC family transcriptional regulator [Pseudorhodoferax sp. Leaf267]|uniref:FlhC family transcriptional regulator n=1 Tax=Pseudorhodoferax sp. Leaf267 TaxID=1736316 RepID=UPI0006FF88C2|nr:FlhC family transcriptional regulator [Pseudorhodoferax sp. Leaf267]KQP23360.1 hypothetical protein ASF43_05740 [Pseudorhodoferax sp. Leaf267]